MWPLLIPLLKAAAVGATAGAGVQAARGKSGSDIWKGAALGALAGSGGLGIGSLLGVGGAGAGAGAAGTAAGTTGAELLAALPAPVAQGVTQAAAASSPSMWSSLMAGTGEFAKDSARQGLSQVAQQGLMSAATPDTKVTTTGQWILPPPEPIQMQGMNPRQRKLLGA
jgi:hypothetical protein